MTLMFWAVAAVGTAGAASPCGTNGSFSFSGSTAVCNYTTPGSDTFTVPAGVSSVSVTAIGAAGGVGNGGPPNGPAGGEGASILDTAVPVTAGAQDPVAVGGVGGAGLCCGSGTAAGGTMGGGAGGFANFVGGGGGGGYSGLFRVTGNPIIPFLPLVIAGGGGGGGGYQASNHAAGGAADSGSGGGAGGSGVTNTNLPTASGGGGGTSSGGGAAGSGAFVGGDGTAGSAYQGGQGGSGGVYTGGGGGGGVYGGGAGGGGFEEPPPPTVYTSGAGGGGGSSFDGGNGFSLKRNTTVAAEVTISWSVASTSTSVSAPGSGTTNSAISAASISSTLSGGASPTGTITFRVFGPQSSAPSDCSTGGQTVGTASVSGDNTYNPSAGFTPGSPGTYWWYASYGGDGSNAPSHSACGASMMSTTVLNTTATSVSAPASGTTNSAIPAFLISSTLSGGASPTGTITFKVFGPQSSAPSSCTSGGTTVGTATVSANSTYNPSAGFTPTSPGTYWWYASYGGDGSNLPSHSGCGAGMTSTAVANPPTPTSVSVSAPANTTTNRGVPASAISATLSGGTSPTGTITFVAYGPQSSPPGDCSFAERTIGTATVSGDGTYHPSGGLNVGVHGTYWWYASYSGDASSAASNSACGSGMPSTTEVNGTTVPVSAPASGTTNVAIPATAITATLSGGDGATGTITFKVFGPVTSAPSDCTTGGQTVGTATVSGNGPYNPSAGFTPTAPGIYLWYASYGGDSGNAPSISGCGPAMTSTRVVNVTASTVSAPASGTTNSAITAGSIASVLSGGANPTGTITFEVFGPQSSAPSDCTTGGQTVGTASVSGNGAYNPSGGFTPTSAGTYWWYASYGGDSSNTGSSSTCGAGMTSTTVVNGTATSVSAPASDTTNSAIAAAAITATLSGGTSPTGTISFRVFGPQSSAPSDCTSGGQAVGTAGVSDNGTYNPSAGFTPASAGTYWWYASYGGDAGNGPSNSGCGAGMTSTTVANVTASTVSAPATGVTGTAIGAGSIGSALTGATGGASGTITFTVFGPQGSAPSTCTSGGTTVGTATVSGSGTYHPGAGYTPATAGTYWWYASYGGDSSNTGSSSTCGAGMTSTTVVNATATSVSAPANGATNTAIPAAAISSTLSGGASPTGTISFRVFGPQASAPSDCTSGGGHPVGTATVSGNGTYHPSAGFTPGSAGTYWWYARYGGDGANGASNSGCGAGMAATTVAPPPTVTSLSPNSGPTGGGSTVVINGANFTPTSTVNFGSTAASSVSFVSSTQLKAVAPAEASGVVNVTVTTSAATSATSIHSLYGYGPPTVSSFTPTSGITGATVTLTGTNFVPGATVKFGSLASPTVSFVSATQLKATVPNGAATGKVSVTDAAGTGTSSASYTVTLSISGFAPGCGPVGTVVTINGVGFNSSSAVKFNGTAASGVTVVSANQLQAPVPSGATSGPITVTNTSAPSGTVSSPQPFTVTASTPPTISSFTPASGITGGSVTLTGSGFCGATSVSFGTKAASFKFLSNTGISATVPDGAVTSPISVTTAAGTGASSTSYAVTLSITGFSPTSGAVGTAVKITGVGFNSSSVVRFNGTTATVTSQSPTQLTATVPTGATKGRITVTNTASPTGTVRSAAGFSVT